MTAAPPADPSPALREREGPTPQAWEGEGRASRALTRLASLATLSRNAGEGLPGSARLSP